MFTGDIDLLWEGVLQAFRKARVEVPICGSHSEDVHAHATREANIIRNRHNRLFTSRNTHTHTHTSSRVHQALVKGHIGGIPPIVHV